jgi:hypothetical protein
MDKDFFVDSIQEISKMVWILLITTLIIEGYLVQRSFQFNDLVLEKIVDRDTTTREEPITVPQAIGIVVREDQGQTLGLGINYGTLALVWPLILIVFFLVVNTLIRKIHALLMALKTNFNSKVSDLELTLYTLIFSKKVEVYAVIVFLFFIMPLAGFLFHAYSGYKVIELIDEAIGSLPDKTENEIAKDLTFLFKLQICVSIASMLLALLMNGYSTKRLIRLNSVALESEKI